MKKGESRRCRRNSREKQGQAESSVSQAERGTRRDEDEDGLDVDYDEFPVGHGTSSPPRSVGMMIVHEGR